MTPAPSQAVAEELPDEDGARLETLANGIHPEDLQLFYQIALQGRKDMSVAPDLKDAFELQYGII